MKQWDHKINISLQVTTGHSALIIIAYRQTLDRASIQHDYVALFWVHIKDKWLKQLRSKVWLVSWPLIALILLRFLIDRRACACVWTKLNCRNFLQLHARCNKGNKR